jgi:uncharacterized membrane protein YfcA
MLLDHLIIFILLALLAEILGTIGGFGSSLFFVPLASFFLDFHSVLGITAIFHVSSNITKIAFFRKGFDKKLLIWIGIPAVVFVIIGAYLSKFIQSNILKILLAIFLILTSLTFLIFKQLEVKPTKKNSLIGGTFSGLVAGLIGTGGAIRGITLAAFNLKMEVFIATSAIIDLGIDLSRSGVYYLNGYIHTHDLYLIPLLLIASILGTYIGKKILERISEEKFKSMVLILIFITGIVTLLKIILA